METYSNSVKRKKRKTRKCLDELRKRSRGNVSGPNVTSGMGELSKLNDINVKSTRHNTCLTNNRLTLAMFPKMIRSETITRPIQSEIKETITRPIHREIKDPSTFIKNNSDSRSVESLTSRSLKILYSHSQSETNESKNDEVDCNDSPNPPINQEMLQQLSPNSDINRNLSSQNDTPGSLILFSPVDRTEESDGLELLPSQPSESSSSQATRSSREGFAYRLYEEFMNEIPKYLNQYCPALLEDDVMKKSRTLLQNMYLEGCRKECETNILHCMSDLGPKKKVPKMSAHSPLEAVPPSQAQASILVPAATQLEPLAPPNALQETPDHAYYPHKLNNS